MKQSKAIIFDLDGVICHTDKFHYLAWKKICDDKNLVFNKKINEKLKGISRIESYKIILNENNLSEDINEIQTSISKKNDYYKDYLKKMDESYVSDDVKNTLFKLKEKGYLLAIGSSSKNAKFILNQIKLIDLFDAISDGTNISKSKPDPEVFLKAAQMLDISPSNSFVVEDAYSGIQAALNAKMIAFAINQNNTSFNNNNVIKIKKLSQILNFI